MAKVQKGEKRKLINMDGSFNLAFSYSDIIKSDKYKESDLKSNRMTLGLKAMNSIATAIAEFDVVCEFINATREEREKWLNAALTRSTKELQSKYTNKATEIKTQLELRKKNERSTKPTVDDLFGMHIINELSKLI